jgi:hypothetical protein
MLHTHTHTQTLSLLYYQAISIQNERHTSDRKAIEVYLLIWDKHQMTITLIKKNSGNFRRVDVLSILRKLI